MATAPAPCVGSPLLPRSYSRLVGRHHDRERVAAIGGQESQRVLQSIDAAEACVLELRHLAVPRQRRQWPRAPFSAVESTMPLMMTAPGRIIGAGFGAEREVADAGSDRRRNCCMSRSSRVGGHRVDALLRAEHTGNPCRRPGVSCPSRCPSTRTIAAGPPGRVADRVSNSAEADLACSHEVVVRSVLIWRRDIPRPGVDRAGAFRSRLNTYSTVIVTTLDTIGGCAVRDFRRPVPAGACVGRVRARSWPRGLALAIMHMLPVLGRYRHGPAFGSSGIDQQVMMPRNRVPRSCPRARRR